MSREYVGYFQAQDREIIYNKIIAQMFPNLYKDIGDI